MNNFLIDYTAYMRSLAEQHRQLQHTPEAKHFFRGELQEFFQQFRSEVRFPCLIAEGSENDYEGTPQNLVKRRTASFIVADRYDQHDDYDAIQLQMSRCEQVAEQLLGRLLTDEDSPFVNIDMSSLNGQYLQNEADRYVGYRLTFTGQDNVCLFDKSAWL